MAFVDEFEKILKEHEYLIKPGTKCAEKMLFDDIWMRIKFDTLPIDIHFKKPDGEWEPIPKDVSERVPSVNAEFQNILEWVGDAKQAKSTFEKSTPKPKPEPRKQETPASKPESECAIVPSVLQQGQAIQPANIAVSLNTEIVKKYFCKTATDEEVYMFIQLCAYRNLNPFLHEVYLIKYGQNPATMVVGVEAFQKRAELNLQYNGLKNGVIVRTQSGELFYRPGTLCVKGEQLVGGWCEVFRKDRKEPTRIEVALEEYMQMKDGKPTRFWERMPGTMIAKVARSQALRQAFTTELGGMYVAEELGEAST